MWSNCCFILQSSDCSDTSPTRAHFITSRCLVYQEWDLAIRECEVHKTVPLVHWVTSEGLPEEHVPVGLPFLIHIFLNQSSDLKEHKVVRIASRLLTSTPFVSKSCWPRVVFAIDIASSSMSSGISAGHSTIAYIQKISWFVLILTPLKGFLLSLRSSVAI